MASLARASIDARKDGDEDVATAKPLFKNEKPMRKWHL